MDDQRTGTEIATLAGGCFWCTEAVFQQVRGVESVSSGYTGGQMPNPTYEQVCSAQTGHAEAARVVFDPAVVSYRDLLNLFFATHDPTTLDRQGADVGPQYRSEIFYHSDEQRATAREVIDELTAAGTFPDPIVTALSPAVQFYEAEAYHKDYFRRNGDLGYCQSVIAPKVAKLRKEHFAALKA